MRPSPAESKWASKCSRSPSTQHACGDVPVAKNLIIQQNFARKPYRFVHGAGGGVTEERGAVPLPLAQTARAHIVPPGWGAQSIALDFWQTKSQTYMPYNHAIRQAKQILYNNTATNRPAHTTPQSSYAGQLQNQQQTATHKTVTYVNIVRQGRALDCTQTKSTQTSPRQTHCNSSQTSTQCTKQAQTFATQHTTVGTQTDLSLIHI